MTITDNFKLYITSNNCFLTYSDISGRRHHNYFYNCHGNIPMLRRVITISIIDNFTNLTLLVKLFL